MNRPRLSRLTIVRIGRSASVELVEALRQAVSRGLARVVRDLRVVQYDPPAFERIEASLLTSVLEQEIGGHILGVTDADLMDIECREAAYMFGGKDRRNDVAVVSTRRLVDPDPDVVKERIVKVALHEIGHNFGLVHHYGVMPSRDGGNCPMTKGRGNRFGERGYIRAVIDQRGFHYCDNCWRALRSWARPGTLRYRRRGSREGIESPPRPRVPQR